MKKEIKKKLKFGVCLYLCMVYKYGMKYFVFIKIMLVCRKIVIDLF